MTSRNTCECFVCEKNGFPETRVYLDGKAEDGRTIYKNEDMSPHAHKQPSSSSPQPQSQQQQQTLQQQQQGSTTVVTGDSLVVKKADI